jgi:membrane protease YdiL (CAAX protease family)
MPNQDATRRIIVYLAIVFAISTIFYILINRSGGLENGNDVYVILLMWSPAVAGLLTTFIFQRNFRGMGWGFGRPLYYLIGYLLPLIYAGIVYGLVWLLGLGELQTGALGDNPAGSLLSTLTLGVLGAALLAVGEEIGWRGLLVPQLARQHPFARTALISGVIWGIWHIPLIIGGGYSSGAPTWFAIICFMFSIIGMSFAFAWLRLASGSIWPAVLMHATHNTFIQSVMDSITADTGNTEYFTTEFGLGLAIMGILVGLLFWRIGLPEGKSAIGISEASSAATSADRQA